MESVSQLVAVVPQNVSPFYAQSAKESDHSPFKPCQPGGNIKSPGFKADRM